MNEESAVRVMKDDIGIGNCKQVVEIPIIVKMNPTKAVVRSAVGMRRMAAFRRRKQNSSSSSGSLRRVR